MMKCPDCLMERAQIVELRPHGLLMGHWCCPFCDYHWQEDHPEFHCPLCGKLSDLVMNPEQAFCRTDDCDVVTFNPSLPDGGLSKAKEIEIFRIPEDQQ
jgi:hypothetical protein